MMATTVVISLSKSRRRLMNKGRLPGASSTPANSFKRRCLWLLGAVFLASWYIPGASAHTLRLRVQPGRALGGEAFLEQPQVEIMEGDDGDVDVLFQVKSAANFIGVMHSSFPRCHKHNGRVALPCSTYNLVKEGIWMRRPRHATGVQRVLV